jgi:hypothetical protein
MARLKRVNTRERRTSRRAPAAEVVPNGIAMLSTGQEVKLINISFDGALLIHSQIVLSPGSWVRLKLKTPGSLINLDGCIQRCKVIDLKQEKVKYEAAIVLGGDLPQELAAQWRFFDEENPQPQTISQAELSSGGISLPDTAELWIMSAREA